MSFYVPYIIENTGRGERAMDIYSRLLKDRIIFIGTPIDDGVASVVIAQLLYLQMEDPKKAVGIVKRQVTKILTPGTVLCRHYQGVDHEVVVQADGTFLHGGQPYTSLSQLAREITGTRWSGPVFFGLKTNVRPKKSARKGGRR